MSDEELKAIEEYEKRDARLPWNDWRTNIYHPRHRIGSLLHEHNHNVLCDALNHLSLDLTDLKVLDVGCGYGYWLRHFVELGANPANLTGIDLSAHRIQVAKQKNPAITWQLHGGAALPFGRESFDFVMQAVVFSSILDGETRRACAGEMYRVTRRGGALFWSDLIRTASDALSRFTKEDVQGYFPGAEIIYQRRTHPQYFRRVNGRHAWLAKSIYRFTDWHCECELIILRKPMHG